MKDLTNETGRQAGMSETTARNATLEDLAGMLKDQHARKVDVVAPARAIQMRGGHLEIKGTDPVLSDEGVTQGDGVFVPTSVCDEGIAEKLGVPIGYLRRLRVERIDMYDGNVNGWLNGSRSRRVIRYTEAHPNGESGMEQEHGPDQRSFLIRCFRSDEENVVGIARAFLSDRYQVIDHLDALTACLDGVRQAGVEVSITGCDLTDRRMMVRIEAPEVRAMAPRLLAGYRSPYSGESGSDNPVVFAGLQISNSETGGGAFQIVPRLVVQVCKNGMTISKDAIRAVHLGGRLDAGIIKCPPLIWIARAGATTSTLRAC